jgi:hypothetical protein
MKLNVGVRKFSIRIKFLSNKQEYILDFSQNQQKKYAYFRDFFKFTFFQALNSNEKLYSKFLTKL